MNLSSPTQEGMKTDLSRDQLQLDFPAPPHRVMRRTRWWLALIVGGLTIGGLLVARYLPIPYLRSGGLPPTPSPSIPISVPTTPSLKPATWRLYENVTYRYALRYPEDWQANVGEPPYGTDVSFGPKTRFRSIVSIRILQRAQLKIYMAAVLAGRTTRTGPEFTVGGIQTQALEFAPAQGPTELFVFVPRQDLVMIFHAVDEGSDGHGLDIFKTMMTTVRFGR